MGAKAVSRAWIPRGTHRPKMTLAQQKVKTQKPRYGVACAQSLLKPMLQVETRFQSSSGEIAGSGGTYIAAAVTT